MKKLHKNFQSANKTIESMGYFCSCVVCSTNCVDIYHYTSMPYETLYYAAYH